MVWLLALTAWAAEPLLGWACSDANLPLIPLWAAGPAGIPLSGALVAVPHAPRGMGVAGTGGTLLAVDASGRELPATRWGDLPAGQPPDLIVAIDSQVPATDAAAALLRLAPAAGRVFLAFQPEDAAAAEPRPSDPAVDPFMARVCGDPDALSRETSELQTRCLPASQALADGSPCSFAAASLEVALASCPKQRTAAIGLFGCRFIARPGTPLVLVPVPRTAAQLTPYTGTGKTFGAAWREIVQRGIPAPPVADARECKEFKVIQGGVVRTLLVDADGVPCD